MINLEVTKSFYPTLKDYLYWLEDRHELEELMSQIETLLSSYRFIYNYAKSKIYVKYIYTSHKSNRPKAIKYNLAGINLPNELNTLLSLYREIEELSNNIYNNPYSLDIALPVYHPSKSNNKIKENILKAFKHCIRYRNRLNQILTILINIYALILYAAFNKEIDNDKVNPKFYSLNKTELMNIITDISGLVYRPNTPILEEHYYVYLREMINSQFWISFDKFEKQLFLASFYNI